MSYYGEGQMNEEKNNLRYEILNFLESHSVGDLLEIITDAVKDHNGEW